MKEVVMKEVNAKAFRAHRELRIMFAAWKTLCPPSLATYSIKR